MINEIVSDILILLIPTVCVALMWRYSRLNEIAEELAGWPKKRWRWVLAGLLIPVYVAYFVTFDERPLLIRITIVSVELAAFYAWVYYYDKKVE
jgi:hypothetical protein